MADSRASIQVAIRIRPFTFKESLLYTPLDPNAGPTFSGSGNLTANAAPSTSNYLSGRSPGSAIRKIVKGLDDRVLVFDPPESNPTVSYQKTILGPSVKKVKDIRYCFDRVLEETATQEEVYEATAKELVPGVLDGFNSTICAYGATGCGKTHTISGSPEEPGIIFLLMKDLFDRIAAKKEDMICDVTISYLEIYNENIRDLLIPNSPATLNLRESENRVVVPGLSEQSPKDAREVVEMIIAANANRTVHGTEANAVSSRSHAVLSVNIRRKARTASINEEYSMSTLSVIDLAGSERASNTKNKGERLIEGGNINRSLLALGNCINALCDPKKSGGHVPYRDSKLTRLLKHSLGGNCRTLMIVCVSPSSHHYDETFNTLQYANRAKEIKTKVTRNVVSVDRHVGQYLQVIAQLQGELKSRKSSDSDRERKTRDEIRAEKERALVQVDDAVAQIRRAYEDDQERLTRAGRCQAEFVAVQSASAALSQWKETAFADDRSASASHSYLIENASSSYSTQLRSLSAEISQSENARAIFDSVVAAAGRKISQPSGVISTQYRELERLFQREVRCLELEIALATKEAAETGRTQASRVVEALQRTIDEVRGKVQTDLSLTSVPEERGNLEDLLQRIDSASRQALSAMLSSGHFAVSQASTASASSMASTSAISKKRTAAMRSPLPDTTSPFASSSTQPVRPTKVSRPSIASSANSRASPPRSRRSPRKSSTSTTTRKPIGSAAGRPSLKPSALQSRPSTSALSNSVTRSLPTASTGGTAESSKGKKGIVWKDDAGEQLTEEHSKSMIDWSDASAHMSGSTSLITNTKSIFGVGEAKPAPRSLSLRTSSVPTTNRAAVRPGTASISEADEDAENQSASLEIQGRVLQDIENDSMASNTTGEDNDSFSSEATATAKASEAKKPARIGLGFKARSSLAPIKPLTPRKVPTARRVSQVGPIRSARTNRRISYIDPSNVSTTSVSTPSDAIIDLTGSAQPPEPRRTAGRTTISFQQKQAFAAQRRSSLAAAGVGQDQGSRLAARVAAARQKRASMAAGGNSFSAGPSGSGRNFDFSLDLSGSNGKTPAWR